MLDLVVWPGGPRIIVYLMSNEASSLTSIAVGCLSLDSRRSDNKTVWRINRDVVGAEVGIELRLRIKGKLAKCAARLKLSELGKPLPSEDIVADVTATLDQVRKPSRPRTGQSSGFASFEGFRQVYNGCRLVSIRGWEL